MTYSWNDYEVLIAGKRVTGIQGFSYSVKRAVSTLYSEGSEPVAEVYGSRSYTASIDVLQNELEAIISAGGGDPFTITPFTVVHTYLNKEGSVVTDCCEGCTFIDITKVMKQNDAYMKITLPLNVRKIRFNTGESKQAGGRKLINKMLRGV